MAVLGLRFCARALSSCGKWEPLFIAVRGRGTHILKEEQNLFCNMRSWEEFPAQSVVWKALQVQTQVGLAEVILSCIPNIHLQVMASLASTCN